MGLLSGLIEGDRRPAKGKAAAAPSKDRREIMAYIFERGCALSSLKEEAPQREGRRVPYVVEITFAFGVAEQREPPTPRRPRKAWRVRE